MFKKFERSYGYSNWVILARLEFSNLICDADNKEADDDDEGEKVEDPDEICEDDVELELVGVP